MDIAQIMKRLDESRTAEQGIKTASVKTNPVPTGDALRTALHDALKTSTEKTAAVAPATSGNPTGELLKLAEDLTNAEEEAMMKQAAIYGAAMCDGFMNRFGQYESAALEVAPPMKTAAAAPVEADFQKFASENPELVKEAYDLGYQQEMDRLVKTAEEDFSSGYNDTMREVHKHAAAAYKQGAVTINQVLRSIQ